MGNAPAKVDFADMLLDPDQLPLGALTFSAAQTRRLAKALEADSDMPDEVLTRVVHHLARAAPVEVTAKLIADLLKRSTSPTVRNAVFAALGTLPGAASDAAMARALKSARGAELAALLAAVASGGGKASLAALKNLDPEGNLRRAKLLAHAETVIAYRLGKAPSAEAERLVTPAAVDLGIRKESAKRVKEVLSKLDGTPYGLTFRDDSGFSFNCAGTCHFVLINAVHKKGAMLKSAMAERSIAALVLREEHEYGRFVPWRIVLLRPEKRGTRVSVTSTQGDVTMVGTLATEGDHATLSLRDTCEARPLRIAGTLSEQDISLVAEVFMTAPRLAQQGQRIKVGTRLSPARKLGQPVRRNEA